MSYNFIFLLDINECDEASDNCEHNCTNTEGSYECICNIGYEQDSNGNNCSGISTFISQLCNVKGL